MTVDPLISGHDFMPGIISVYADQRGQAWIWRRVGGEVRLERDTSRPCLFAWDLRDLEHLGSRLVWNDDAALFSVHSLKGPEGSLRYLLTARDG